MNPILLRWRILVVVHGSLLIVSAWCLALFSGEVLLLLSFSILFANLALAHFCHVSLLVALCARHVFPFDLADVLLVWAAASVACDWCVTPATCVAGGFRLLDPLLFFGESPAGCVHPRLPFVDFVLHLLHRCCIEFD